MLGFSLKIKDNIYIHITLPKLTLNKNASHAGLFDTSIIYNGTYDKALKIIIIIISVKRQHLWTVIEADKFILHSYLFHVNLKLMEKKTRNILKDTSFIYSVRLLNLLD